MPAWGLYWGDKRQTLEVLVRGMGKATVAVGGGNSRWEELKADRRGVRGEI